MHPDFNYTEAGQAGDGFSLGLFSGETVIGRFNLAEIVRGPFQSGVLSYWMDSNYTGSGLTSAAILPSCSSSHRKTASGTGLSILFT